MGNLFDNRRVAGAIGAVVLLAGLPLNIANAADMVAAPEQQFVEPQFDSVAASSIWNGAYAGLYGGVDWTSVGVMGSEDIKHEQGKELGGYIGFNQALGDTLVGGVEWMGGYGHTNGSAGGIDIEKDWETSLRARMGYAFERNLVYGLAGVAASRVELSDGAGSDQKWMTGWTVGGGVERQFTNAITGRIEYDYTDLGKEEFDLGGSSPEADLTSHGVKVGVGFKF